MCFTCPFPNCSMTSHGHGWHCWRHRFCAARLCQVLSPEGNGISVACSEVILPSATGQLGILANHAPMMSALDTGVLRFKEDGKWKPLVVMGGFATVDSNQLSVLVNDFEEADAIDMKEAQSEMDGATSMLEKAESKKDKLEATAKATSFINYFMEVPLYMMIHNAHTSYTVIKLYSTVIQLPVLYQLYWTTSGYGTSYLSCRFFFHFCWQVKKAAARLQAAMFVSKKWACDDGNGTTLPRRSNERNRFHFRRRLGRVCRVAFSTFSPCCAGSTAHRHGYTKNEGYRKVIWKHTGREC